MAAKYIRHLPICDADYPLWQLFPTVVLSVIPCLVTHSTPKSAALSMF